MNNNKKIYELTQPSPRQLEIKSYAVRYYNCDFIHAYDIATDTRRIFERKKLNEFKNLNKDDYLENELVLGFTNKEEFAENQLEKIKVLYEIQYLESELCDLDETRSYYDKKIKDATSRLEDINKASHIYKPLRYDPLKLSSVFD